MATPLKDLSSIEERLGKVERQNRRLKIAGGVALVLIWAVTLLSAAAPKPKTVDAERFVVVDNGGKQRAAFGVSENGASLKISNEKGKTVVLMEVSEDGTPVLAFKDENSTIRALLTLGEDDPILSLHDENETPRAMLLVHDERGPSLSFRNKQGETCARVYLAESGPRLEFSYENGSSVELDLVEGGPTLFMRGKEDKSFIGLGLAKAGPGLVLADERVQRICLAIFEDTSYLSLRDENNAKRGMLSLGEDGTPKLQLYDKDGKVVWQAIPEEPPQDEPDETE